ncbi:polyphosphate--glucose phosphotransferase [Ilumatobacter coccineus]|uniref:Polyphosphate glucokinase n=1 Tax=Ilumatobacter coccineus (strain NBRC 103263 / KCTC 29153 / YM16-304) TaxID=1313172 RepID=A0A6C7E5I3_ILUCY|nr:ROK family protein [Ilumatobacter coccineus]BAN02087.1 polyphosphate glucokinase [Ilumatobacter coccineus YM16-304]
MSILGIDVGGSGVKGAIVDTQSGELLSERIRIETPTPPTPANIAGVVQQIVSHLDYSGPVGCSFPTVVVEGKSLTAGNIDTAWRGTQVDELFGEATGLEFVVHNDADVAGIAEMTLGAGRGLSGTTIMITIGTGLGSGVFFDGMLIPNIELGRMPGHDGEPIEFYAGDRARKADGLGWDEWGERFNYFLQRVARVFTPAHFILGGGASKKLHKFGDKLDVDASIHVAHFRNNAGIVGAALAARDGGLRTGTGTGLH